MLNNQANKRGNSVIKLKYKITKFDRENLTITAVFPEEKTWAEVRLANPLPKNVDELEDIIRRFASPREAIEARINPDSELSYIDPLIEVERECERYSLDPEKIAQQIDPEVEADILMWENGQFEQEVKEVLINLGVINKEEM